MLLATYYYSGETLILLTAQFLIAYLGWTRKRDSDVQKHKAILGNFNLVCEYATSDYLRQTIILAKTRHPKNLFMYVKKMVEHDEI